MWNIMLDTVNGENRIVRSNNQPVKSGKYLCTCVSEVNGKEVARYLHLMQYDKESNCWHDVGNKNAISHNILAWRDDVEVCDFTAYDYKAGYFFKK